VSRVAAFIACVVLAVPLFSARLCHADDALWNAARTEAFLKAIRAASDHGLEPGWYGLAEIDKALSANDDRGRIQKLLSEALVAYASDVSTGRVRANSIDPDINIEQRKFDKDDLLKQAAEAPDFAAWLADLAPKGDYPALQKALAELRQKRGTAFTELPDGDALKPGMTDPRVPLLRKRLAELELSVPATGAADRYDEALEPLVRAYQDGKGLTVDGVIGTKTTRSLNTTIDERIEQLIANLERRRWLTEDFGSRYVMVNIGDYSMVFVDQGQRVFESLVIVGTPQHPTPEVVSTMYGFQTNPYWTVPPSFAGEEYLPLLRRDPAAFTAGGFKLFSSWSDNDSEVDPQSVDWSRVHPKAFPYRIRQEPGAGNALGYIFFPFANKYGIYMHDTATRWLFSEGSRNFSHGCIRLRNPLDFAEKVFKGKNGFDKDKVQAVINAGQQASYSFPESVKIYVTYRTVNADGGTVTFRDDVYGRDRRVAQAMGKSRS
jgi:murein L,D-transpeptidase YcbB/YkuD